jgi:hypothetical protein
VAENARNKNNVFGSKKKQKTFRTEMSKN